MVQGIKSTEWIVDEENGGTSGEGGESRSQGCKAQPTFRYTYRARTNDSSTSNDNSRRCQRRWKEKRRKQGEERLEERGYDRG